MAARPAKKKWKRILPKATLTVIPFTAFCSEANAFFPPLTPPPPVVVVVPPVSPPPIIVVPPVSPPPFSPPPPPPHIVVPPVSPPPIVVPPVSPGTNTPEPATLLTGLIGLAAVAGYRHIRRKENEGESQNRAE